MEPVTRPTRPSPLADPLFWAAVVVALALRAAPMLIWDWASDDCTRDECIYKIVAKPILSGEGLGLAPAFWLPAPGYAYLMAACHALFGNFESVKWVQWALTVPTMAMLYALAARVGGEKRAARLLAWGFAIHPTFVFYTGTMWTETVYTTLLVTLTLGLLWAREGGARRAIVPGLALGLSVLFRGVATYLAPIVVAALVAPEVLTAGRAAWAESWTRQRGHAAALVATLLLVVAPYSVAASLRWGGFVVSDATLGHVASLGNDDFPPVTFDYGIGQLTGDVYDATRNSGQVNCPRRLGVLEMDQCKIDEVKHWIAHHKAEFVRRIPTRLAQLFNPHSFLTRHLRWNDWPGIPWELKELLVAYQALFTMGVVWLGTLAIWGRARGAVGLVTVGLIAYTVGVIATVYGISRFRLPLEPFWMLWLAVALTDVRGSWRSLTASNWRLAGAMITLPTLIVLTLRYAWSGWPGL